MARGYHANIGSARRFQVISIRVVSRRDPRRPGRVRCRDRLRFEPLLTASSTWRRRTVIAVPGEVARQLQRRVRPSNRVHDSAGGAGNRRGDRGSGHGRRRRAGTAESVLPILRDICDRYGVLLIFDEVLTGLAALATSSPRTTTRSFPDLICLGKGISSGYAPLAAVVARDHVAAAFRGDPAKIFLHGHTYGGHLLACDTGLAVTTRSWGAIWFARRATTAPTWGSGCRRSPRSIRDRGCAWTGHAVVPRVRGRPPNQNTIPTASRLPSRPGGRRRRPACPARGSPTLILAPPLTVSRSDIDEIVEMVDLAIGRAREEMRA